jgi:protocatechuate 3,4-dioxygenase beta subunit
MQDQSELWKTDNEAYVRAVHDRGFTFDLTTMNRRRMLTMLGGGAATVVAGGLLMRSGTASAAADCAAEIESETAGPYPADGSNGVQVRTTTGVVRSDIRSSFGTASGVAGGVPLVIELTIQDLSCAPLAGAAVYLWHCDREGRYSLYSTGVTDQNYLRGIQETDSAGVVRFTSIVPACYSGRWPHIHFEVYSSLADATNGGGPIRKTSQVALPEDVVRTVYQTGGYSQSVTNLGQITIASDNVFGDDLAAREMATMSGDVTAGYTARLTVTVDPTATETSGPPPSGGPAPSGSAPSGPPPSGGPTGSVSPSPSATTSSPSPTPSATTRNPRPTPSATTRNPRPIPTRSPSQPNPPAPRHASPRRRHWWWPF